VLDLYDTTHTVSNIRRTIFGCLDVSITYIYGVGTLGLSGIYTNITYIYGVGTLGLSGIYTNITYIYGAGTLGLSGIYTNTASNTS